MEIIETIWKQITGFFSTTGGTAILFLGGYVLVQGVILPKLGFRT